MDLHLKYRPSTLKDFRGNRGLVESLQSLKKMPHSFMFVGPSGAGKTTLARIMANAVGCGEIIEVNASDTRGIDFARNIIATIRSRPISGKPRAFIFDEFQQATTDAQNALLKPLEDTPDHAYFFICTTNPEKVLKTIKTRCTTYSVNPLNSKDMRSLLQDVADAEKLVINPQVIDLIIEVSEGSARTALILLGMLHNVNIDDAIPLVHTELYQVEGIIPLCKSLMDDKWEMIVAILKEMKETDYERIRLGIVGYFSSCLKNTTVIGNMIFYVDLLEILMPPLNYTAAKNDLTHRLGKIFLIDRHINE